jgi:hypothetical protein
VTNVTVVTAPWNEQSVVPTDVDGIWADPSRRTPQNRRARTAAAYQPTLETILRQPSPHILTGIKVGPGDVVPTWATDLCTSEYIGFQRDCRERILWHNAKPQPRFATLLPNTQHLHEDLHEDLHNDLHNDLHEVLHNVSYLIEPHNVVIASGLVREVFAIAGVHPLDPNIAYGVGGEEPPPSAWYERFRVLAVDRGVTERRIRERVVALGFNGHTEIKKRGWNGDPEVLRTKIAFPKSGSPGVIMITRRGSGHVTIYAVRL